MQVLCDITDLTLIPGKNEIDGVPHFVYSSRQVYKWFQGNNGEGPPDIGVCQAYLFAPLEEGGRR